MLIFLDAAFPGTAQECVQAAQVASAQGFFVYTGGERNGGHWTVENTQALRALGYHLIPIFVGLQAGDLMTGVQGYADGLAAVAAAKVYGFPGGPVVLDVEASTAYQQGTENYVQGWVRAVRLSGWKAWVYSLPWFCKQTDCDGRWGADYVGHLVDPASLGLDAVQCINSTQEGPIQVDISTVNLSPEVTPVSNPYSPHTVFGQRDPQWASFTLGGGPDSFGVAGCLLTCFAMVAVDFGHSLENPATLNDKLLKAGAYVSSELLGDDALGHIFSEIQVAADSGDAFQNSPADLSTLNFDGSHERVIVEVDFDHNPSDGIQTHFLVLDSFDGTNIFVRDPWYGTIDNFATNYGTNPTQTILKTFKLTKIPAPAPPPTPVPPPPAPAPAPVPAPAVTLEQVYALLQKIATKVGA